MNKIEYLFEAFRNRSYVNKTFLLSIFSIVKDSPANNKRLKETPYALFRDDEKKELYFYRDNEKVFISTDPSSYPNALFHKNEMITVDTTDIDFVPTRVETTIGILLTNLVVIFESVGEAGSFINGVISARTIKGLIDSIMVDNQPATDLPPGKATVNQCLKITKNLDYLEGMNQVFVKASSFDALTVHKEVIELRDRLLKELEDQGKLDDPTAVAIVINEIMEFDAKIQYGGPSKDFYINKKFIDNARKKMFVIFDMIPDYNTGKYTLLRKSLAEGWDPDLYPELINTAISASFDRGNATGEGGAEVKVAILLTNRMIARPGDCGTPRTETVALSKYNIKGWVGGFHMVDGKPVKVENKNLVGQTVQMRVPQYCIQPDGDLCYTCCGDKLGAIPERVSPEVVYIFTGMMLTKMKAMHVSQLITIKIDLKSCLR